MPTTHAKLSANHSIYSSLCCLKALASCTLTGYAVSCRLAARSLDNLQISQSSCWYTAHVQFNSPACCLHHKSQLSCLHVLNGAMHIHVMLTNDVDTPTWSTADLIKYMEKSTSTSSGGRSAASTSLGGIIGSSVAPAAIGVQYMSQPAAVQPQGQPLPQGVITTTANCTADCAHSLTSVLIAS